MSETLHIVMVPADRPGSYWPTRNGERLTKATRQPFYDGARALLGLGVDGDSRLTASHVGESTVALQSTVAEAARWSVSEPDRGKCHRIPYQPYSPAVAP